VPKTLQNIVSLVTFAGRVHATNEAANNHAPQIPIVYQTSKTAVQNAYEALASLEAASASATGPQTVSAKETVRNA